MREGDNEIIMSCLYIPIYINIYIRVCVCVFMKMYQLQCIRVMRRKKHHKRDDKVQCSCLFLSAL